jgi:hypothetical protein
MFDPSLVRPLPPAVTGRRIDAAVKTTRIGAQGRTRAEVRELLVTELRAQGLMPPPAAVDLLVNLVAGGPAQRAAQRLTVQAKLGAFVLRFAGAASRHRSLPDSWDVTGMRHIHSRLAFQPVDVVLDHDAGQHLAVGDAGTFEVWFDLAVRDLERGHSQPADGDTGDQPVAVFRGEYQVGVLDPETSAAYRPLVQEGRDGGHIVVADAARKQAGNGEWRLLVGLPLARRGPPAGAEA